MCSSAGAFGLSSSAWDFSSELQRAFSQLASATSLGEVKLFGYLKDAFASLSPAYQVDVYHGQRSQVYQAAQHPWTKSRPVPSMAWGPNSARCELADLALVWYRKGASPQARVTFLQAKKFKRLGAVCLLSDPVNAPFKADSTQWHLLNKRPEIAGASRRFRPPRDLLSAALLPSVASYGVFYDRSPGSYDMFYASADCCQASIISGYTNAMTCAATGSRTARTSSGLPEAEMACCLEVFGAHLYHGNIGTPIHPDPNASIAEQDYRRAAGAFVMEQIAASAPGGDVGPAAVELGNLLSIDRTDGMMWGNGMNVIVVRGSAEEVLD